MGLYQLQTFLDYNPIPKIKKKPKTFLGIAKQPHYENVLSNIYAFYFKTWEEHGTSNLFIKSLIACIKDSKIKNKDFSKFKKFKVKTEYPTIKNGRVDLLLYNQNVAIIIESKVYHYLDNDLDDYWDSVQLDTDAITSKIRIILSLKPISKDQYQQYNCAKEFINITHLQLMKEVSKNLSQYENDSNQKHIYFIKGFNQNISNISRPVMSKENINFYVDNKTKINQLVNFKYEFKKHVIAEVENAGNGLENVNVVLSKYKPNADRLRHYESTKNPELVYTIVFEDLLQDKNILHIIVEPRGNTLKNGAIFKTIEFEPAEKEILKETFYNETNNGWAHFAWKAYELTSENIANLASFIQGKIKDDHFESIMQKLENYLMIPPPNEIHRSTV